MNFSAAEIVLVISNKADVQGLRRAENAGIATKVILLPWQQSLEFQFTNNPMNFSAAEIVLVM